MSGYAPVGKGLGTFTTYVRRSHAERFNVNQAPDDNVRSLTTNGTAGANLDWRWTVPLGGGEFSLRTGADASANRVHIQLFTESPANAADRTLTTDVRSPSWDVAGYALGDYRLGRITLSGGFRYDYIRIPFENQLDPAADTTNSFHRLSPRARREHRARDRRQRLRFHRPELPRARGARARVRRRDGGLSASLRAGRRPAARPGHRRRRTRPARQLVRGPAIMTASVYRTDVRDDISFIQSADAVFEGFFDNIGNTRREGVELGVQVLPSEAVSLYANYAFTRATYRDPAEIFSLRAEDDFAGSPLAGPNAVEVGDRLPLVPAHQVKAGGLVQLPAGVSLGPRSPLHGPPVAPGDEANETEPLGGYFTASVRAGLTRGDWELSAVVTNVFDSHAAIFYASLNKGLINITDTTKHL